eukprot:1154680-Pelagomonas_calceolata.AAC.4
MDLCTVSGLSDQHALRLGFMHRLQKDLCTVSSLSDASACTVLRPLGCTNFMQVPHKRKGRPQSPEVAHNALGSYSKGCPELSAIPPPTHAQQSQASSLGMGSQLA